MDDIGAVIGKETLDLAKPKQNSKAKSHVVLFRSDQGEFGIVGAGGAKNVPKLVQQFHKLQDTLPEVARTMLWLIVEQLQRLAAEVVKVEKKILAAVRANASACRLLSIPGVGPITASAITASVPDINTFSSGRRFASWLGLTPRPHSSERSA